MQKRSFKKSIVFLGALWALHLSLWAQSTAPTYTFTHIAGPRGGSGNADGGKEVARFNTPSDLTIDPQGTIYITDVGNRLIRKVSTAGVVSTIGSIFRPSGIVADNSGNIYVADSSREIIYRVSANGEITEVAGQPYTHYYGGTNGTVLLGEHRDGTGTDARFLIPRGMAIDAAGNILIADSGNHVIRKLTPSGVVTTIAGRPGIQGNADGNSSTATFNYPSSIAIDAAGTIYIAEIRTVRRLTPDGTVTTLAGSATQSGSADGIGTSAQFFNPCITANAAGTIYVADTVNHTIRKITPEGVVTTLAGSAGQAGSIDGSGSEARFNRPTAIRFDHNGNLIVADSENDTIRQITTSGVVTTLAGKPGGAGYVNGEAGAARFNQPSGITVDAAGNLYIADPGNNSVRKITPNGEVSTFSGGTGLFRQPNGVAFTLNGVLLSADAGRDRVATHDANGIDTTLAGGSPGFADGPIGTAKFHWPLALAVDKSGNIYVADTANKRVRKITPNGTVSTLTSDVDAPNGVAVDDNGNVYVADRGRSVIHKITSAGSVSIFAGAPNQGGTTVDGPASTARFNGPCGVAVDRYGNVFVADTDGNTIRRISPDGVVSTIGGNAGIYGSADGVGSSAHFHAPHGIAVTSDGTLYITEEWNHAIRKGSPNLGPTIQTQPQSQTVVRNASVTFSVVASGSPAPTYQWYFNGQAIQSATSDRFTIASVRDQDVGSYSVVVTNSVGSTTSTTASLTVAANSTPSAPSNGSSGGGGAPSIWFGSLLTLVAIARGCMGRAKGTTHVIDRFIQ